VELVGGWSQDELTRLARSCAARYPGRVLPYEARYDTAFYAMVVAVLEGAGRADAGDLWSAATRAISAEASSSLRHRGIRPGGEKVPSWSVYWHSAAHLEHASFEPVVDERLAVAQVWEQLSESHQETLGVYGWLETNEACARYLGVTYGVFAARLHHARIAARSAWFDWEPDPGHYRRRWDHGPGYTQRLSVLAHASAQRQKRRRAADERQQDEEHDARPEEIVS